MTDWPPELVEKVHSELLDTWHCVEPPTLNVARAALDAIGDDIVLKSEYDELLCRLEAAMKAWGQLQKAVGATVDK